MSDISSSLYEFLLFVWRLFWDWGLRILGFVWLILEALNKFSGFSVIQDFLNKPKVKIEDAEIYRKHVINDDFFYKTFCHWL